jgi:hypothetical protein
MRLGRRRVLTASAALLLSCGAAFAQPVSSVTLEQIMAALRSVRHVQARYVERRTLRALREPLQTSGTLRYDAPDRLEKIGDPMGSGAEQRPGERLAVAGDQLTLDRGQGKPPVTLVVSDHPEIGAIVESIRATLAGDGAALSAVFEIGVSGSLYHWQLVLQPREGAARRMLAWMRIAGSGPHIAAIDTQQANGDRSEMQIFEPGP